MKNIILLSTFLIGMNVYGQTIMNIYQKNAPVLKIPLSTIDSITYTTASVATISTTTATFISGTNALTGGNISNDGGATVTARGVAFDTTTNPTTANNTVACGSGSGAFTAYLNNLTTHTRYYARAYAINSAGTSYGNQISFLTDTTAAGLITITILDSVLNNVYYHQTSYLLPTRLVFPNLKRVKGDIYFHSTNNIAEVEFPELTSTQGYFYFHGNINMNKIIAPKLVAISRYFYVYNNKSLQLLSTCNLSDIYCDGQEPYVAIAGNAPSVDSIQPCFNATLHGTTLITTPITTFSSNTAIGGGTITSACGSPMAGVCWSTSPKPTINDYKANATGGTATFIANLTGLTPNTTYYVRAFSGTVYGNEVSFTTSK